MIAKPKDAGTTPELFGVPTSNLALFVSGAALLIAGASILIAWLSYRRSGSRIRVEVDQSRELGTDPVVGAYMKNVFLVTVMNGGHASATVRNVSWRVRKGKFRRWDRNHLMVLSLPGDPHAPGLPRTVQGNSEELFRYDRQVLETNVAREDRSMQLQAQVVLAGGKRKRSNKVTIEPTRVAVSSREASVDSRQGTDNSG